MSGIFRLDGETVLITGGGTGLGLGMARCFIEAGAKVVLVGRRKAELDSAAADLGKRAFALPHDVTELERAGELIARAGEVAGSPISVLVNNAGNHLKKPAHETTPTEFQHVMQTHVSSAHALSAAILPGMYARGRGNILFTASMASYMGVPNIIAYTTAKTAYLGLVRGLAAEASPRGVRVNGIAPGWIDSPMLQKALSGDPARKAKILSRTPMEKFGDASDIGWAAVYLCSPAAKFVTGVVLPVDGGASIGF